MNVDNIFLALTEANEKTRIDAVIALNREDAISTINQFLVLSNIVLILSLEDMAKLETEFKSSNFEFIKLKHNEFGSLVMEEISEEEAENTLNYESLELAFSKEMFLELLAAINLDFMDKLNHSPIISSKLAGEIIWASIN